MDKITYIFFYGKLTILNGVIILFGFGFYHLLNKAIELQNVALVGELIPLGALIIGLGTLEINQIFKHMRWLKSHKEKEQHA